MNTTTDSPHHQAIQTVLTHLTIDETSRYIYIGKLESTKDGRRIYISDVQIIQRSLQIPAIKRQTFDGLIRLCCRFLLVLYKYWWS